MKLIHPMSWPTKFTPLLIAFIFFSVLPPEAQSAKIVYGRNKSAQLADGFAKPMQCVIQALQSRSYIPRDVGCFGARPHNASAHPTGHACDVDQTGRDITRLGGRVRGVNKPGGVPWRDQISLAQNCNAVSGCAWPPIRGRAGPDCGHFEARSKMGYVRAGSRIYRYGNKYAAHPTRRYNSQRQYRQQRSRRR